ncbi:MAG TPA: FAD-binding oxidoreductase [Gammaproteobacteria bacterium]|nr:FAD-binding oxidoreductase [Gammaproteobacteria bacterium]
MNAADLDELRALLGAAAVLHEEADTARYLVDERRLYRGRAAVVLRPGSTAEVARAVAWCHARRIPMVPHGGNTGYCGGATPDGSGTEAVISLERMQRVRSLDPAAFALTVEAGMTLAAVQTAAADAGLLFPLSMGSEGSAQIGGVLSTNAGGLAVLRYGTARDLVLGLEVVLPDGRVWDGLRGLRKDNTGYDLRQCFIGAEGTLGILTAAVLKLFPAQPQCETAWLGVRDAAAACRVLGALRRRLGDCMSSFEYLSAASLSLVLAQVPGTQAPPVTAGAHLLIEFTAGEGDALRGDVERALLALIEQDEIADAALAQSASQRRAFWRLRESVPAAEKALGGSIKHDVSVRLDRLPLLAQQASEAVLARVPAARLSIYGHVGDGNLHFNVLAPVDVAAEDFKAAHGEAISALVHGVAQDLDGSFSAEHGVGKLKRELLAAAEGPVAMDLMRALKRAFDPLGLMNPGKVL